MSLVCSSSLEAELYLREGFRDAAITTELWECMDHLVHRETASYRKEAENQGKPEG